MRSFSYEQLVGFAERRRVHFGDKADKDTLIRTILEALEEDLLDQESLANLAIQMESKKFSVSHTGELYLPQEQEVPLPGSYHETLLRVLQRDPAWVFVYWEIEAKVVEEFQRSPEFANLVLRILEHPEEMLEEKGGATDHFDVPITLEDNQHYVNLPKEESYYTVELWALYEGKEERIARSQGVWTMAERIQPGGNEALLRLSFSSAEYGEVSGVASYENVHRINLIDDLFEEVQ